MTNNPPILADQSGAAGAPAWFGPAMAAALAPINARPENIEVRQTNSVAVYVNDILHPLRNTAGNIPSS